MVNQSNQWNEADWEYSEENMKDTGNKNELCLEDFIEEELPQGERRTEEAVAGSELHKTAKDVKNVMELGSLGRTIPQIAEELGLDPQYVYNIQICAQGFREDDTIAVAHLVMMG